MADTFPLPSWNRIVIKVGSALVAPDDRGCSTKHLGAIARFISASRAAGQDVILVSSGAVAAGLSAQSMSPSVPRSIPERQALAAIGQPLLMAHWRDLLDGPCAQLLLTYDDLYHRRRFVNAQNTLAELLDRGTLPIINENDTVAVEELKVGDNDNLSAHVAVLADADLLLMCSDVDGLYTADPHADPEAEHIPVIEEVTDQTYAMAGETHTAVGTGGMTTKIEAAEKATTRGIDTVIMNGTKANHVEALRDGQCPGTLFKGAEDPLSARKYWMLHAVPSRGRIVVDEGAAQAISQEGASLLPAGITEVEGRFSAGDAVDIVAAPEDGESQTIAKGLSQYSARDVRAIQGRQSHEIDNLLDTAHTNLVIHRDELVLASR